MAAAESVAIPGGEMAIEFSRAPGGLDRARMLAWVQDSAKAVTSFYGRFPVENRGSSSRLQAAAESAVAGPGRTTAR